VDQKASEKKIIHNVFKKGDSAFLSGMQNFASLIHDKMYSKSCESSLILILNSTLYLYNIVCVFIFLKFIIYQTSIHKVIFIAKFKQFFV